MKVLDTVAEKSGWGKKLPAGTGMGIAIGDGRRPGRQEDPPSATCSLTVSVSKEGGRPGGTIRCSDGHRPFLVNRWPRKRQNRDANGNGACGVASQEITIEKGAHGESNFQKLPLLRATEMPEIRSTLYARRTIDSSGSARKALGWGCPVCVQRYFCHHGGSGFVRCPQESQPQLGVLLKT